MVQSVGFALVRVPFRDGFLLFVQQRPEVVLQLSVPLPQLLQLRNELRLFRLPSLVAVGGEKRFVGRSQLAARVLQLYVSRSYHLYVALEIVQPLLERFHLRRERFVAFARLLHQQTNGGTVAKPGRLEVGRVQAVLDGGVPQLYRFGHQLKLVPLGAALLELVAHNFQRLHLALQLPAEGCVLEVFMRN